MQLRESNFEMRDVTVNRKELLDKIEQNKSEHAKNYRIVESQFKTDLAGFLGSLEGLAIHMAEQLQRGTVPDVKQGVYALDWPIRPQEHSKDYDKALTMIGMSVDDQIKLTDRQFTQLVLDEWDWKDDFNSTMLHYSNKANGL